MIVLLEKLILLPLVLAQALQTTLLLYLSVKMPMPLLTSASLGTYIVMPFRSIVIPALP
jgi:hypothetical protein